MTLPIQILAVRAFFALMAGPPRVTCFGPESLTHEPIVIPEANDIGRVQATLTRWLVFRQQHDHDDGAGLVPDWESDDDCPTLSPTRSTKKPRTTAKDRNRTFLF